MYHELSEQVLKRKRRRHIMVFVLVCVIAVAGFFGYRVIRRSMNEQAAVSMRQSILEAANQCAAVEGAYPLSLSYLEENYGLTINHEDFVITYQAYANNLAPSVVVIPR